MDTADHLRDASPWTGEPDKIRLALLGKLAEELGELQQAIGRCIIQGVDGKHPVTGKPNLEWLWEEACDVQNLFNFLTLPPNTLNCPDWAAFSFRIERKRQHIKQWLDSIRPTAKILMTCGCPCCAGWRGES